MGMLRVFMGEAGWTGDRWQLGYASIRTAHVQPIRIEMNIKITDENDKAGYYVVNSPFIVMDQRVIAKYPKS